MSEVLKQNPEWSLKLSSCSMNISAAVAKLKAYQREVKEENRKDELFYQQIIQAFKENSDTDKHYAEYFNDLSFESDSIEEGEPDKNG